MAEKGNKPLTPLIDALAEWAVDDAIEAQEKHPDLKRKRLNKRGAKHLLEATDKPAVSKPRRKGKGDEKS